MVLNFLPLTTHTTVYDTPWYKKLGAGRAGGTTDKIRKYARSDWPRGVFAWEYANMVVASRCFAFRALITQTRIWKSFGVQNSTSLLYLPIPSSAETYKIVIKVCQFFFAYFGKHLFAKQELISVQDFVDKTLRLVRISLLISAIQRVLRFFSRRWENSRQLCKPETK